MTVEDFDLLGRAELHAGLTACCGARRWVEAMLAARPFGDLEGLHARAEEAADRLDRADWLEAFSHHPRIGDLAALRARFGARSGGWSEGEQEGMARTSEEVIVALGEGNRRYEERFGHLFIVCATGKSAAEMLALLEARLANDPDVELRIAAAEQRKITRLRLDKLLAS